MPNSCGNEDDNYYGYNIIKLIMLADGRPKV